MPKYDCPTLPPEPLAEDILWAAIWEGYLLALPAFLPLSAGQSMFMVWVHSLRAAFDAECVWLQMLQELMHQMQASTQGFAARFPNGSFPIPSLDAGQPNIGQWRQ